MMLKHEPFSVSRKVLPDVYYQRENELKEKILFPLILRYYEQNPTLLEILRQVAEQNPKQNQLQSRAASRIFYRKPINTSKNNNSVSLRFLDALVSVNSNENLCYYLKRPIQASTRDPYEKSLLAKGIHEQQLPFNLTASYRQQLHYYQKRYFDSFRRRTKVSVRNFATSYCQLNFFIWLHQFEILQHISDPKREAKKFYLFLNPQHLPAIPIRRPCRKLLLTPQIEYTFLQSTLTLHCTLPLACLNIASKRKKLIKK